MRSSTEPSQSHLTEDTVQGAKSAAVSLAVGERSAAAASPALEEQTRAIMRKGSKTFSLAALLFDRDSREGAQLLYTWCRACDDAVDNEPDAAKALATLEDLRAKTHAVFQQPPVAPNTPQDLNADPDSDSDPSSDASLTFEAFATVARRHRIEEAHAQALLDGMQMDVEGARIRDDADLHIYCYRVAGVVGLMMSKIMGVLNPNAHQHAIDTGLAMQMTNISRDIKEDFDRNRIYIPESWQRPNTFDPQAFAVHAKKLVDQAEALYASGEEGLKYLPLRAALAVGCAQVIYREIGRHVVQRGRHAWDTRTVVPLKRKLSLMARTIAKILASRARLALRRRSLEAARIPRA